MARRPARSLLLAALAFAGCLGDAPAPAESGPKEHWLPIVLSASNVGNYSVRYAMTFGHENESAPLEFNETVSAGWTRNWTLSILTNETYEYRVAWMAERTGPLPGTAVKYRISSSLGFKLTHCGPSDRAGLEQWGQYYHNPDLPGGLFLSDGLRASGDWSLCPMNRDQPE